ncbi:MAG TPA: helix-turn-helix domain-containing protein [Bryobacteraceae bacterium]|nr:helix-turn-helix domain-containing protein [Bryobacteraceae bacterium]
MNALSNLWQKLHRSKRYRESFPAAVVKRMLPLQIRVLRKQRGWSQAQLAHESQLTQGVISRAEDPDYGNLTVNTLVRIGAGFDCAFVGRFVPFSELAKWYTSVADEKALEVPSFAEDQGFPNTLQVLAGASVVDSSQWPTHWSTANLWTNRATTGRSLQELAGKRPVSIIQAEAKVTVFEIPRKGPRIAIRTTPHLPPQYLPPEAAMPYTPPEFADAR